MPLQFRRGTAAQAAAANPVLVAGEPAYDTTNGLLRVGDGVAAWSALDNVGDHVAPDNGGRAVGKDELFRRVVDHGVVADGATADHVALATELAAAAAAQATTLLTGTIRTTSLVTVASNMRVRGAPGAKIVIDHANQGLAIGPPPVAAGSVSAAAAGGTTVTVSGAGWTVDAHAGKWVSINGTYPTVRRVLSNTATVLTLQHALGTTVAASTPADFYTPIPEVTIDDLTIDRTGGGSGANVVFSYIERLTVNRLRSLNAGTYTGAVGNGVSIYHCDRVRGDVMTSKAGQFGLFVYNCDDVRLGYTCDRWGGQFGAQLKDCRDAQIIGGHVVGDGVLGDQAYNIKCSGLNPSYDCSIIDSYGSRSMQSDFEFSSITTEGTYFSGRNFSLVRPVADRSQANGFSTVIDAGAKPTNWTWDRPLAREAFAVGFAALRSYLQVLEPRAIGCGYEGMVIDQPDVRVRGGVMQDNCQRWVSGVTRSSEIHATSARSQIEGMEFRRTTAGKSLRAVRDGGLSTNLLILNPRIVESTAALSQDYLLSGTGAQVIGRHEVDSFTGAPTIIKKAYTVA